MDVFKVMLASMLEEVVAMEEYEADEVNFVPYLLKCEMSFLRGTLEDVERRMKKNCNGY